MEDDVEPSDVAHVNLVFFGPCGCGKSTTAGRLIADCGAIDEHNLERVAREATEKGEDRCRYAWILDKLRCERERGGTMYQALWRLSSQRCHYTIIDAPGHDDFTKDIVTAMSQADIAVLVVAADLDASGGCEEQIREHALLAYTLGLRQIVVCVTKMDCNSVSYSQEHFGHACDSVCRALENVGLKTHDIHFVPISGWIGDNVAERSENMDWYCGPTLLEAMDDAVASHFKPERPLRFPLYEVMQIGGQGVVVVGRVATGSLRPGMELVFAPGNIPAKVLSMQMHHEALEEAVCGDSVNVVVNVDRKDMRRGMVGSVADDNPAFACSSFLAHVIVLSPPRAGEIAVDCTLSVECHTAEVKCKFEELLSRKDRRTGEVLEMNPASLQAGDAAVVRLRPETPLCVEAFSEYPPLGRFAVRDQKTTVAVGVVQQIDQISEKLWACSPSSLRSKGIASRSMKGYTRHSNTKPKAHTRSSARSGDSGEESDGIVSEGRLPRPKADTALANRTGTHTTDSGDDSPQTSPSRPIATRVISKTPASQSPFAAFGGGSNPSPFAAFGAITKKQGD